MPENQGKIEACFSDARWALFWSADVLRRRYLPKIGAFWRESGTQPSAEADIDLEALTAEVKRPRQGVDRSRLPEDADERQALALKVEEILRGLGEGSCDPGRLLRQLAWGDGWSEAAWRTALAHQELARRQGLRVRLSYRYTCRQLASLHDCDAKAIWRRVRMALTAFALALEQAGLLWEPEGGAPLEAGAAIKPVKAGAFKQVA